MSEPFRRGCAQRNSQSAPVRVYFAVMARLQNHLRNTFLAGIFAATPLAITAWAIWYVEDKTRSLFHVSIPFVGVVIAIGGLYLLGLIVTSVLGRWIIGVIDRILARLPVFRELYRAWKHVSVTPVGSSGMFEKSVLVPAGPDGVLTIGFTSGLPIPGGTAADASLIVFLPGAPNPMSGRLVLVPASKCRFVDIPTEEAFKLLLSGGNYVPATLR